MLFLPQQTPNKVLSSILGKSNLQFAGMSIMLNISTASLNLMTPDMKQVSIRTILICESFGKQPSVQLFVIYQNTGLRCNYSTLLIK